MEFVTLPECILNRIFGWFDGVFYDVPSSNHYQTHGCFSSNPWVFFHGDFPRAFHECACDFTDLPHRHNGKVRDIRRDDTFKQRGRCAWNSRYKHVTRNETIIILILHLTARPPPQKKNKKRARYLMIWRKHDLPHLKKKHSCSLLWIASTSIGTAASLMNWFKLPMP